MKIRRLKGKGKRWIKGHSSSSNPSIHSHRKSAQSRFFQENLDSSATGGQRLTESALRELDNNTSKHKDSIKGDNESWEDVSSTIGSKTVKTFETFTSMWSNCSNVKYSNLMNHLKPDSALHREMLAVFACTTEVIEKEGGTGTDTEYYAAFVTTLESIDCDEIVLAATLTLLGVGIRSVPREVLIATFPKSSKILVGLLMKYADSEETMIIRGVLKCLYELLKVQPAAAWNDSSTTNMFETLLAFTVHSKPKVRKVAHTAVCSVLKFRTEETGQKAEHPAAAIVANFCIRKIEKNSSAGSVTTLLHVFNLLKDLLDTFPKGQLKTTCESILKGMTLRNPIIATSGLCVLENMFLSQPDVSTLSVQLNSQLIAALYDFQPPVTDVKPTVAWIRTMESGFVNLAKLDKNLFMESMPRFFTITSSLWLSGSEELTNAVTISMSELIKNNIAVVIKENDNPGYQTVISKLVAIVHEGLKYQYHLAWKPVLHLIAVVFKELGECCKDILFPYLQSLAEFRDSHQFTLTSELDHAIGAAVKSMGPQVVLEAIPLKMTGFCTDVNEEFKRSWLVPILKENIHVASLQCFMDVINPLITTSRNYALKMEGDNNQVGALSYTLLETQLWALLPSFCIRPTDFSTTFPKMAQGLGHLLNTRKDLRLIIMMALRRLITYCIYSVDDVQKMSQYAKNYLPILFNIYTTESKGSDEEGVRLASLETIKMFLVIASEELRKDMYKRTNQKFDSIPQDSNFLQESVLDLLRVLVPFQPVVDIVELFDTKLSKLKDTTDHKQQKKYYRILEELCASKTDNCVEFINSKIEEIKILLLDSLSSSAPSSRGPRLKCLLNLMKRDESTAREMISSVVPEAVLCCCDINSRCRATAFQLLETMCNTMEENMDVFVEIVMAGLTGPPQLVTATIMALTVIVKHYKGNKTQLTDSTEVDEMITSLVNKVCLLLCSPSREISKMAFSFLEMYVSCFPRQQILFTLPEIIKAFSSMTEDCKNCFRRKTRDLLAKFVRWFGLDSITHHIPTSDAILIKRVKNLHKIYERKKRQRQQERENRISNKDSESEPAFEVKPVNKSIDELLEDVYMSDLEIDEKEKAEEKKKGKTKRTKNQVWLQEEGDNDIVDFTNISAAKRISATNPLQSAKSKTVAEKTKKSNKNHGFKTAPDGRLIIKEDSDSESDTGLKKIKKKLKPSSDSESDYEDIEDSEADEDRKSIQNVLVGRKRKLSTGTDETSGRPASKYQAGGKGIHRPVSSKESVADSKGFGSLYKSKKGSGDVKRKGLPNPYAYLPLQRSKLNRRKKMKASTEFKNIVRSAKKGAKIGTKLKQKVKRK